MVQYSFLAGGGPLSEKILVTAALPYANGPLHLGHLAGAYVPADVYVRYQRLKGADIVFVCGSDEHGVPITIRADREGITPQEVVDRYHVMMKRSFERLGIAFDNYSRTSLALHHRISQDFFLGSTARATSTSARSTSTTASAAAASCPTGTSRASAHTVIARGHAATSATSCGRWLEPEQLIAPRCKLCGSAPEMRATTPLVPRCRSSRRSSRHGRRRIRRWKPQRTDFVARLVQGGAHRRGRSRATSSGAIPVPLPGADGKVLYVWFDAPIGYISFTANGPSGSGRPSAGATWWQTPTARLVHFIGKDNIVFHAIVWPAMLMAHGDLVLPCNVPANEFLTIEGRSLDQPELGSLVPTTTWSSSPPTRCATTSRRTPPRARMPTSAGRSSRLATTARLADVLGNLVNRSLSFVEKNFDARVPAAGELTAEDRETLAAVGAAVATLGASLDGFQVRRGTSELMDLARTGNKYFNDAAPWSALKRDRARAGTILNTALQLQLALAVLMEPILPFSAERLWTMLGAPGSHRSVRWDAIAELRLPDGAPLGTREILFSKIEDDVIDAQIARLRGGKPS